MSGNLRIQEPAPPWRLGEDVKTERLLAYLTECSDRLRAALGQQDHAGICGALRGYVYRTVNWSNCGLNTKRFFHRFEDVSISDLILLSCAKEVGFLCGGTSEFLRKLYGALGYDAYVYNHGLPGVSTHVTTLVMVPGGRQTVPVFQDATFNFTLEVKGTSDAVTVFRAIARGDFPDLRIVKGAIGPRNIYFLADAVHESFDYYQTHGVFLGPARAEQSAITHTNLLVVPADLDYDTSYRRRREAGVLDALSTRLGRPRSEVHISQLMLFPIEIGPTRRADHQRVFDTLLAIAAEARKASCPQEDHATKGTGSVPMNVGQMVKAGVGMYDKGDASNALNVFRHAVAVDPEHANAWNNLGVLLVQQNQISEGLRCFQNAFRRDRTNGALVSNYVSVLRQAGRSAEAHDVIDQYLQAGGDPQRVSGVADGRTEAAADSASIDDRAVPFVPVQELHRALGFQTPIDYPASSLTKSLSAWKMEIDDMPIFRYLYRHVRPRRHLEFGTWQGAGVVYCLQECDATVWTLNLPFGESQPNGEPAYSGDGDSYGLGTSLVGEWARRIGLPERREYPTDSFGFIGRFYLEKQLGHRVCQIFCDSRQWDTSNYPPGFFDTALIDGGHFPETVASDSRKALSLLRPGGLILWHDFCPPMRDRSPVVQGVMQGVESIRDLLADQLEQWFWIKPSHILVGRKKT